MEEISGLDYLGHELSDFLTNVRELQEHNGNNVEVLPTLVKIEKLLMRALYLHDNLMDNKDYSTG